MQDLFPTCSSSQVSTSIQSVPGNVLFKSTVSVPDYKLCEDRLSVIYTIVSPGSSTTPGIRWPASSPNPQALLYSDSSEILKRMHLAVPDSPSPLPRHFPIILLQKFCKLHSPAPWQSPWSERLWLSHQLSSIKYETPIHSEAPTSVPHTMSIWQEWSGLINVVDLSSTQLSCVAMETKENPLDYTER